MNTMETSKGTIPELEKQELSKNKLFKDLKFYLFPVGFGPSRLNLFKSKIIKHGGVLVETNSTDLFIVDYIIVEDSIKSDALLSFLCAHQFVKHVFCLHCAWLSKCISSNELHDVSSYLLLEHPATTDYGTEKSLITSDIEKTITVKTQQGKRTFDDISNEDFACAHPSRACNTNLNAHITDQLKKLANIYESKNDKWRSLGYQRAITAIEKYPTVITSAEDARNIKGVGERLADKIGEIVECGRLKKVSEVCNDEEARTLHLFMGIWGTGPTTAHNWYIQHQKIGLKYYYDFNERISRDEINVILKYVREVVLDICPGAEVIVCGSYRRGKLTCGDIDILITNKNLSDPKSLFKNILHMLRLNGFLTADLVIQENNGNQCKYLGVCKLFDESSKHRRIDIIVVPPNEYAPALMYFTGSAHFNRSMRLLASKMGMSLSEHGLCTGVVRQGKEKVSKGKIVDTLTEESIFSALGLQYRCPEDRDH